VLYTNRITHSAESSEVSVSAAAARQISVPNPETYGTRSKN